LLASSLHDATTGEAGRQSDQGLSACSDASATLIESNHEGANICACLPKDGFEKGSLGVPARGIIVGCLEVEKDDHLVRE
jgi:hypothetical protein